MGLKYWRSLYPQKPFPMKTFVEGIMAFIKDAELEKLNEAQEKLQSDELAKYKDEYLANAQ